MKYELSVNLYYSIIGPNTELHRIKLRDLKITTDRAHKKKCIYILNFSTINLLILFYNRVHTGVMEIVLINIYV